jgi:hypothetical protein
MKHFLSTFAVSLIIVFSPSSFAATSDVNERRDYETRELKKAVAEAEQARSEDTLNDRILAIANEVALQDKTITAKEALNEVILLVDGEEWVDTGWHRFGIINSLLRSQGLAIDEMGKVWYSSEYSLLRAKSVLGGDEKIHIMPIPKELKKLGDNHIGDIDIAAGKIYAGIEDGPSYKNPYIGVFDSRTLKFEKAFRLPQDQQVEGVPWAAVEPQKNLIYSSEYYHPTAINVYDMTTGNAQTPIQLSREVPSAQGAKVFNGMMYMTSDGSSPDPKAVFKVNLATGTVMLVAVLDTEITELEGLGLSHGVDGLTINALAIGVGKHHDSDINKRAEIHILKQKKTSMRDQLRQKLGIY